MPPAAIQHGPVITTSAAESAVASYRGCVLEGADAILERLRVIEASAATALAFQRLDWLTPLYKTLAQSMSADPIAVEITDAVSGDLALFLPLVRTRAGRLSVVSAASLGVSDYGGPILGPAAPMTAAAAATLVSVLRKVLTDDDLLELSNMPREICGRLNPLAFVRQATAAVHAGHALTIETTVEAMIAARGKKYRKESERCFRLLAEKGTPCCKRASTEPEVAHAYAILEAQQLSRRADGGDYVLDRPGYSKFYAEALRAGLEHGTAHIFTLKAGDETGAVLFGISHGSTFTLLRISTAQDEAWKRMSPGRLIVIETMRAFAAEGVTTFDMGIGSYAFKHGFGTEVRPLFDLVLPLSAKALPRAGLHRAKAKLRNHPRLMTAAKRLLGHPV